MNHNNNNINDNPNNNFLKTNLVSLYMAMRMRSHLSSCLSSTIFLACLGMVLWQVWCGTMKYLACPVASKVYTMEAELPVVTVCHNKDQMKIPTMHGTSFYKIVKQGRFQLEDNPRNKTLQEGFDQAIHHYYFLLDYSGKYQEEFDSSVQ